MRLSPDVEALETPASVGLQNLLTLNILRVIVRATIVNRRVRVAPV